MLKNHWLHPFPTELSIDEREKGNLEGITHTAAKLPLRRSFLSITRTWTSDDTLTLQLPIGLRSEAIKDERPEYASIQAILFGPFLLAGLTTKDWNINARNSTAMTDWITSIPASSRSQLVSLSQRSNHRIFFLSNSNYSITMNRHPKDGTNGAVHSTFRLVPRGPVLPRAQLVMLEPFDLPGMVVVHHGSNNSLKVSGHGAAHSVFRLVPGLDGDESSASLESEDRRGCFVCTDGTNVKLMCKDSGLEFGEKASFRKMKGLIEYDPISFVAKGTKRNFLLEPLHSLRDETYTAYFNIVT